MRMCKNTAPTFIGGFDSPKFHKAIVILSYSSLVFNTWIAFLYRSLSVPFDSAVSSFFAACFDSRDRLAGKTIFLRAL